MTIEHMALTAVTNKVFSAITVPLESIQISVKAPKENPSFPRLNTNKEGIAGYS